MIVNSLRSSLIFLLISCLAACTNSGGSSDDPGSGDSSLELNGQSLSAVAGASGKANFSFVLPAGSTAFQVASSSGFLSALSGSGGDLLDQPSIVSGRQLGAVTNVPYYAASAIRGQSFNASYSATQGSTVELQVFSKADPSLTSGTLRLNIVYLGPVAGAEDVIDAMDDALEVIRITYGRAGISIDEQSTNFEGPAVAPPPGDPLYQSIISTQRPDSITVVLASRRKGSKSGQFRYGTVGTTPFPIIANANSVIVIGIEDITGSNQGFDQNGNSDEKRILGEEIGRFTAEALGLPLIVTLNGNNVSSSDNIPDTESCLNEDACQQDSGIRTNLMFPEPLDKLSDTGTGNEYYPRDQLTAQQKQVLNNSVFVD